MDGGLEAKKLSVILVRMLLRGAQRRSLKVQILDEDGLSFKASGTRANGLSHEAGLHKFITKSKDGKKHTSFCKVEILVASNTVNNADISESDVEFKTQKASGPGGQHVNKTESAVRATHKPTGHSVLCSSERSQAENKRIAIQWLSAKIRKDDLERELQGKNEQWRNSARSGAGAAKRSFWMDEDRCVSDSGAKSTARFILDGGCEGEWA